MREIKFRAWEEEVKTMHQFDSCEIKPCRWVYDEGLDTYFDNASEDVVFMQYTGLKDKNGVEIYDGDILSLNGDIHTVGYQNGCFLMIEETISDGKTDPLFEYFHEYETDLEVIGNIYENPELLEEKHE